jgi:hypothetical protein
MQPKLVKCLVVDGVYEEARQRPVWASRPGVSLAARFAAERRNRQARLEELAASPNHGKGEAVVMAGPNVLLCCSSRPRHTYTCDDDRNGQEV